jgi:aconitase B
VPRTAIRAVGGVRRVGDPRRAGADTALWITTDQVPSVPDRLEQAVSAGELGIDRVTEALIRMASAKRGITNRTR